MSKFFANGSGSDDDSEEEVMSSSGSEDEQTVTAVAKSKNKFLTHDSGDDSSDESEEVSESEDEDEDEEQDDDDSDSDSDDGAKKGPGYYMRNQFLKGAGGAADSSDSESEDDSRRVVKSAKDKLIDEIDAGIKAIENARKINDWLAISGEFDKINKLVDRATKQYQTLPPQYIVMLGELDDFSQDAIKTEKSAKKKMNASNSKALNTVKQRIKKTVREHETKVAEWRNDKENFVQNQKSVAASPAVGSNQVSRVGSPAVLGSSVADADTEGFATVGRDGKTVQQSTPESIFKTLVSIVESRGKKNTDRAEQIRTLESLVDIAETPYQKISVLLLLVPIRFDLTSSGSVMAASNWGAAEKDLRALFDVLEAHAGEYRVTESAAEPESLENGPEAGPDGVKEIPGSVSSLIERLDDELTRALQQIDPHTTEYVERLRDEPALYQLILRGQVYIESLLKPDQKPASSESLCRLLVRRLDHIYFKPTSVIISGEKGAWESLAKTGSSGVSKVSPAINKEISDNDKTYTISLVDSLCSVLYQQTSTQFRTKAMLSHIYHYALNDRYFKARDLFLMSHLQSSIHTADPTIQVLYNRALVQVGLCAFRLGLIPECQQSLQEVCSSSRLKELLGQGVTKFNQQVSPDKQRLLPFHMHINLELLECVYLTASLLIEVPLMASLGNSIDAKKRIVSKPFRRMLDYHDRQVFTGPPENTRDHIMQAAKALLSGDWTLARDLLTSVKIWSLLAKDSEAIKSMLAAKLQQEGLRTYLFTYASCYDSLSVSVLASLFDLEVSKVTAVVSKMIASEEIAAALDQKSKSIVFRRGVELSKLQILAQALSERAVQLAERNERLAAGGHQLPDDKGSQNKPSGQQASGGNSANSNQRQNRQNQGQPGNQGRPRAVRA